MLLKNGANRDMQDNKVCSRAFMGAVFKLLCLIGHVNDDCCNAAAHLHSAELNFSFYCSIGVIFRKNNYMLSDMKRNFQF